jgi:hypothetical protein
MKFGAVLAGLFAGTALALDTIPPYARGGVAWKQVVAARLPNRRITSGPTLGAGGPTLGVEGMSVGTVTAGTMTQLNDHFGNQTGTFSQRYYIDTVGVASQEALLTAPIVLYISGEGAMDSYPQGYWTQLGFDGLLLLLSSRFREHEGHDDGAIAIGRKKCMVKDEQNTRQCQQITHGGSIARWQYDAGAGKFKGEKKEKKKKKKKKITHGAPNFQNNSYRRPPCLFSPSHFEPALGRCPVASR